MLGYLVCICNTIPYWLSACEVLWEVRENRGGIGGTAHPGLLTLEACLGICVAEPTCVGVDLDLSPNTTLCWLHYSLHTLNNTRFSLNITQVQLVDRCSTGQSILHTHQSF